MKVDRSKYRVLIVDDNPSMRKLLGMIVEQIGVKKIDYASNGLSAIELSENEKYNMIIMDNYMPKMTGVEFLHACHKKLELNNISLLFVMAAPDERVVNEIRSLSSVNYDIIAKPFDVVSVKSRIMNLMH